MMMIKLPCYMEFVAFIRFFFTEFITVHGFLVFFVVLMVSLLAAD